MAEPFTALIMAAGHGTRMKSVLPKVLHPVCGKPMVGWVIDAARAAGATEVVCVTRPGDGVEEGLPAGVTVAEQTQGEGTGAAVLATREAVPAERPLAVLSGDHPLVAPEVIASLVDALAPLTFGLFAWLFLSWAKEDAERQELLDLADRRGFELDLRRAARAVAAGCGAELAERIPRQRPAQLSPSPRPPSAAAAARPPRS